MLSPRILVVEDDAVLRHLLHRVLVAEGYQVCLAANGRQALEALALTAAEDEGFDGVLLDLGLPDLPGLEVCRAARAHSYAGQTPAVLVMSGSTASASARAAREAGADQYLIKPFTISQLKAVLQVLLARRPQPAAAL